MKSLKLLLLIVVSINILGCVIPFKYYTNPKYLEAEKKQLKVSILPFEDHRSEVNRNAEGKLLIPGKLYGFHDYEKIDEIDYLFTFQPKIDFAKALTNELKENELFHEVFFVPNYEPEFVLKLSDSDYHIKGEIRSTRFIRKYFSYGLSVFGTCLWLFGLPAKQSKIFLSLKIRLIRVNDNKEVWSHDVYGEWKKIIGIYYNSNRDYDGYVHILKDEYKKLIIKLNEDIKSGILDLD